MERLRGIPLGGWLVRALPFLVLAVPLLALDPNKSLIRYGLVSGIGGESLATLVVNDIQQTSDGYLWLATNNGLLQFDGVKFVAFTASNSGLPGNSSNSLAEDNAGTLWIGQDAGLCGLKAGAIQCLGNKEGMPKTKVYGVTADRAGGIWFASSLGLSHYRNGHLTTLTASDGLPNANMTRLMVTKDGTLWAGTYDGGAFFYRNSRFESLAKPALPSNLVWDLAEDRSGDIWLATFSGLCRLSAAPQPRCTVYTHAQGLPSDDIVNVFVDREGRVWASSEGGGLSRFEGDHFSTLATRDGLSDSSVRSIAEDREGNLWVGTKGGLNQLHDRTFSLFGTQDGLIDANHRVIIQRADGTLWAGTNNQGLEIIRPTAGSALSVTRVPVACSPLAAYEDTAQDLWLGCAGGVIQHLHGSRVVETYPLRSEGRFVEVNALTELAPGRLVAATFGLGIAELRGGRWVGRAFRPEAQHIAAVFNNADGLWSASLDKGLFLIRKDGSIADFSAQLAGRIPLRFSRDRDGSIWVVLDHGVAHIRNGVLELPSLAGTPLADCSIYSLLDDGQSAYWLTTSEGVFRLPHPYLAGILAGRKHITDSAAGARQYGFSEGVMAVDNVGYAQPTAIVARDGTLWFATHKGLLSVDSRTLPIHPPAPPLHIALVLADDRPLARQPGDRWQIPAGRHRIEIQYTALSFTAPNKVQFRYQLQGVDSSPIDPHGSRAAIYTDLPPGTYRFSVTACNSDGTVNSAAAFITQDPHYYQSLWFRALCALSFVGLALVLYRLHTQQIRREAQRIQAAVESVRRQTVEERAAELARANQVLRKSAASLANSSHPDDFIESFLREVIHLSGASAGAFFRRISGTEFAIILLIQDGVEIRGAELDALPCAVEKRQVSREDFRGYYSALTGGKVMSWHEGEADDPLPPLARAYHQKHGHKSFWEFPLSVDDQVTGSVAIAFHQPHGPSEVISQTLDALNCQLAIAMEVARLTEDKRLTDIAAAKERAVIEERSRIAREIHDTLAQNLSGILIQLRAMFNADSKGDQTMRRFHADRALELAQSGLEDARRSLASLRPVELDGRSLHEALAMMAKAYEKRSGIPILLQLNASVRCSPEQELELLRITQEGIANAIKHSGASKISVEMQLVEPNLLELCVRDNGRGFDPNAPSEGFGLTGMQERAARINATFLLTTNESGTSLCVRVTPER